MHTHDCLLGQSEKPDNSIFSHTVMYMLELHVDKINYKVLQVIVSFCFMSLKSNSEDSDTGTLLVHCIVPENIHTFPTEGIFF